MRFLEREVYAFLSTFDKRGERVRGAMPWARIFFVCGKAAEDDARAGDGPAAGGTCEELADRAIQKERHARSAWKKGRRLFLFFLRKIEGRLLVLQVEVEAGPQLLRP